MINKQDTNTHKKVKVSFFMRKKIKKTEKTITFHEVKMVSGVKYVVRSCGM